VDILINVQETILLPTLVLTQSTVRVNYFEIKGHAAKMVECIHYDYVHPPQDDQHPVFHAQFDDKPITPDGGLRGSFNYTVEFKGFRCFKSARIPTADMTFSSVLLSLAADHLGGSFFQSFKEKVLSLQDRLPHPDIEDLRRSLGSRCTHLKSSHWFARRPR
jgi:hypothetical protein